MKAVWILIVIFAPANEPKRVLEMNFELTQAQCEESAKRMNAKNSEAGYTAYCAYVPKPESKRREGGS